jgi:hypothetical protein
MSDVRFCSLSFSIMPLKGGTFLGLGQALVPTEVIVSFDQTRSMSNPLSLEWMSLS